MSLPNVYADMLQEYFAQSGAPIPATFVTDYPTPPVTPPTPPHPQNYTDPNVYCYIGDQGTYIAQATKHELYTQYNHQTPRHYTPYRRISHFREHLNRLMYCQYVSISQSCLEHIDTCFSTTPSLLHDPHVYTKIHKTMYVNGYSKYVEHIHYLISRNTRKHLSISYTSYHMLRDMFLQMEKQFHDRSHFTNKRKNFVSYHIIIQFLLFLLHLHPRYYLPTIKDIQKREYYYSLCLLYFSETESYNTIIEQFIRKKTTCKHCRNGNYLFDRELVELLLPPP